MTHVLAGLEPDFLRRLPRLGSLAGVPRALDHDAVPLVRVRVRPAHHARRKSIDREIEARLRRVAFEDRGLHAKLVVLGRVPLELVDVEPDEFARRERAELGLPIRARARRAARRRPCGAACERLCRPRDHAPISATPAHAAALETFIRPPSSMWRGNVPRRLPQFKVSGTARLGLDDDLDGAVDLLPEVAQRPSAAGPTRTYGCAAATGRASSAR